ncbi:MAG: hypothetical protein JXA69_08835, partial [Phycisphaerae bacterium]|nr:hypothetical protein [Phycisphaerae bacterium]
MTTQGSRVAATLGFLIVAVATPSMAAGMTEAELCDLYLGVVEDAVSVFEPLWTDVSASVPNAGYFDFIKYDTWLPEWYGSEITVCGNGQIVFCYALLLNHTDKATFTDRHVPRAVLRDHAIQAIRWCCLTSGYVENPYPFPTEGMYPRRIKDGKYWIRPHGHRTDVLGWLTTGIAMLWDELDEETRGLVEDVMIGMAPKERIVRQWTFVQGGNHDVVKQDMSSTVGAAFLFPGRDDHDLYLDIVRGNGIDLVSTMHDRACAAVAAGKPIREWSKGWNLYPDYSSDHHGWCQIWYGCDLIFEGRYYIEFLSRLMNIPVLETFTYPGNGFDGVLEWIKST